MLRNKLAFAALLLLATTSFAEKYAFVDIERALMDTNEGQKAGDELKKEFALKQKMLDKKKVELEQLKSKLDKQGPMMKKEAKFAKERELQQKAMEAQALFGRLQQEMMMREQQTFMPIQQKMDVVLKTMGRTGKYDMILKKGGTVLYGKNHLDLTNELVRKYNAAYKSKKVASKKKTSKKSKKG